MIIQIRDGKFFVDDFATEDEEILAYFEEVSPENIEERFESSLRVGVIALKTIGTTEKIDYIQKEFDRLGNRFTEILDSASENISEDIEETFGDKGKLPTILEDNFGENGRLPESIAKYFGKDGTIMKDLFDPLKEGTPLYQLRALILEELGHLKEKLGIREAEEEIIQKTALKGVEFEDECEALLADIVKVNMGDELNRTTNVVGAVTDSKKGDFTINVKGKPEHTIVLETKDRANLSLPEIHRELDEAMENREAKYAIFVAKRVEALPKSVGCFNCYKDDRVVCALGSEDDDVLHREMLQVAYFWARTQILKRLTGLEKVDLEIISSNLAEMKSKLDSFSNIKRQCTNIEGASNTIKKLCDKLKDEINTCLRNISGEMEKEENH